MTAVVPDDVVDAFEQALRETGRTRIEHNRIWQLWQHVDPAWADTTIGRRRLADALTRLADSGVITLPARPGVLWDTAIPSLPLRITVPSNSIQRQRALDPATEPWTPTLDWVPSWIRATRPSQRLRVAAVEVNRWLLSVLGRPPAQVAREERSLHIFGDEKRLAAMTGTALFGADRMRLRDLHCTLPHGGLRIATLHRRDQGRLLVVENKSTFDSTWRALAAARSHEYAAVVFGAGDAAAALVPDLVELPALLGVCPTGIDYAGDIDIAGIEAAASFIDACNSVGLSARPAVPLWDAVAKAQPTGDDITADTSRTAAAMNAATRLAMPAAVIECLRAGVRVPQERIDRTSLADTGWWTARV